MHLEFGMLLLFGQVSTSCSVWVCTLMSHSCSKTTLTQTDSTHQLIQVGRSVSMDAAVSVSASVHA